MQACMVSPCPHPARRYLLPNSSPTRKGSAGSSPAKQPDGRLGHDQRDVALQPISQALAQVSRTVLPRREINHTSLSLISTGKTRASSANWSKVPPLSRSKRA